MKEEMRRRDEDLIRIFFCAIKAMVDTDGGSTKARWPLVAKCYWGATPGEITVNEYKII